MESDNQLYVGEIQYSLKQYGIRPIKQIQISVSEYAAIILKNTQLLQSEKLIYDRAEESRARH